MGRQTFNDVYKHFAVESHKSSELDALADEHGELSISTEDWTGGVAGLLGSFLPGVGFFVSPTTRAMLKAKEKELDKLTQDLRVLSVDAGKKAVAAGKMDASSFHKLEKAQAGDFLTGALIQFVPFYNLYKAYDHADQLQDTMEKIEGVKKEIDEILRKAAVEQARA